MAIGGGKTGGGVVTPLRAAPAPTDPDAQTGGHPHGVEEQPACRPGALCETCQAEVRSEALLWLRDLNRTYSSGRSGQGRLFSTMSSSVRMLHQCHPPEAYIGKNDDAAWRCPSCGMTWRLQLLAQGYSFGPNAGPYLWGEWLPEGEPPQELPEE